MKKLTAISATIVAMASDAFAGFAWDVRAVDTIKIHDVSVVSANTAVSFSPDLRVSGFSDMTVVVPHALGVATNQ